MGTSDSLDRALIERDEAVYEARRLRERLAKLEAAADAMRGDFTLRPIVAHLQAYDRVRAEK